jgi:putative DNA methylase
MSQQMMAIACTRQGRQGKIYLSADDDAGFVPDDAAIGKRIENLCQRTGLTVPNVPIVDDAKNSFWTRLYAVTTCGSC